MVKKLKKRAAKQIEVLETKAISLDKLKMFHKNPNVGNVPAIAESLKENGQFKPIIVNKGTETGRGYEILGGNHTYLGARELGWGTILCSIVDVDDEHATKIVLADNKTASLAKIDDKVVAELFASLPDVEGTGYDQAEMDAILADVQKDVAGALAGIEEDYGSSDDDDGESTANTLGLPGYADEDDDASDGDSLDIMDDDDYEDEEEDAQQETDLESADEELVGLTDIKEDIPSKEEAPSMYTGYWGIPKLRTDMLVQADEVPANLTAWAGSATKNWPDLDQWWLYNWGIDSTSGMRDVSKVIVSFYCWDEYFENWFWDTRKFVVKLLNSKIKMMVTPNYSQWPTQAQTLNLWAIYRSRYVGRYAQEAGIKIIPDINWPFEDEDFLRKIVLSSLPKKVSVIAMQAQTNEKDMTDAQQKNLGRLWKVVLERLDPDMVILYANGKGRRMWDEEIGNTYKGKVMQLETRVEKLSESQKGRAKKHTI